MNQPTYADKGGLDLTAKLTSIQKMRDERQMENIDGRINSKGSRRAGTNILNQNKQNSTGGIPEQEDILCPTPPNYDFNNQSGQQQWQNMMGGQYAFFGQY